jgi:hypothetical protein
MIEFSGCEIACICDLCMCQSYCWNMFVVANLSRIQFAKTCVAARESVMSAIAGHICLYLQD